MYIRRVLLKNYRNFKNIDINLSDNINIFYGDNAQGKTNFLEAIYLSSKGRSYKTQIYKELINFNEKNSNVQLIIEKNNMLDKIDIHLKNNNKKGIAINSIPIKKLGELYGVILTVIFSPEDLNLIKGGPRERRKFIDIEMCQLSKIYHRELIEYYKVLKQRNALLKSIKLTGKNRSSINIWDEQLVKYGCKIIRYRREFIRELNNLANKIHSEITNNKEDLRIEYLPNVEENIFYEKVIKNIEKDIYTGITSIGIHKDDLNFFINDVEVRLYASQGQQRTVTLSTKLAEMKMIKIIKDEYPILLLDDVMSELDKTRQEYLLKTIKNIQTIITCTNVEDIINSVSNNSNLYLVKEGVITL